MTHRAHTNQQCVELAVTEIWQPFPPDGTGTVIASIPANDKLVPKGYYMLFLVSTQGTVGEKAAWIKVQ